MPPDVGFEELFDRYRAGFIAVARSYVRDGAVAEDIVTDCFVWYWENRSVVTIQKSVPAYILASVKNRCLNWLRDERNRLKIQQQIHLHSSRVVSQRISTLEAGEPVEILSTEISGIVERTVEAMPDKMRNVFTAGRIENKTYKQIAEQFDISVNQVDFEMRKATTRLSRALRDYLPEK